MKAKIPNMKRGKLPLSSRAVKPSTKRWVEVMKEEIKVKVSNVDNMEVELKKSWAKAVKEEVKMEFEAKEAR